MYVAHGVSAKHLVSICFWLFAASPAPLPPTCAPNPFHSRSRPRMHIPTEHTCPRPCHDGHQQCAAVTHVHVWRAYQAASLFESSSCRCDASKQFRQCGSSKCEGVLFNQTKPTHQLTCVFGLQGRTSRQPTPGQPSLRFHNGSSGGSNNNQPGGAGSQAIHM